MHKGLLKAILSQGGFDPITNAYVAGMQTKPSKDFIKVIDELIKDKETVNGVTYKFKNTYVTAKGDVIYLGNINNSNDSFRNIVKNLHHGTIQGSGLVFDPYWGWTNPLGTGYVDTNYNPATQGVNYTLNNAGIGIYPTDNGGNGKYAIYCYEDNTKRAGFLLGYHAVNDGANGALSLPFYAGLQFARRTASNARAFLNQNLTNVTSTQVSTSIPNSNFYLFRHTAAGGVSNGLGGLNFTYIGASLTDDEFTALNIMVNRYLKKCLYLKYGADNWGVKMAKSYFDTLHNFEPYEAWEIYDFINRHQSDYVDGSGLNIIPSASSDFTTDGTAWWSCDGTKAWNSIDLCITATNQQHLYRASFLIVGRTYTASFKYRSSTYTGTVRLRSGSGVYYATSSNCTANWQTLTIDFLCDHVNIGLWLQSVFAGSVEYDDIIITEKQTTGYYYNTFGTSGQNKTVADFIMLFKAGGNLSSNAWTKAGATLRWNQDGYITSSNTMPAYTRGANLGIVTLTSTDGWDGVTQLVSAQTSTSVNSYYGNFPKFFSLKTGGSKVYILINQNRMAIDFRSAHNFASLVNGIRTENVSYPGYFKINISDLIGGSFVNAVYIEGGTFLTKSEISGDVTALTNEIAGTTASFIIRYDKRITGSLENIVFTTAKQPVNFQGSGITKAFRNWRTSLNSVTLTDCALNTAELDAFLAFLNTFYATNTPTGNLTLALAGAGNGIPTGGTNNTDLLGIIAKFAAAGRTASITVRTS